jgi:hypothetical protein
MRSSRVCFANASSTRPHAQPAPLSLWDARPPRHTPNSRDRHGQFPTRGVVDRATWWIVLLDRHESQPILHTSSVPNTGWIAPTARAASQAPGPMLRSPPDPLCLSRVRSHVPDRLDAGARTDTCAGVTGWMTRQGLCDRLDRLGPASAVMGFLLAVATVRDGPIQDSAAGTRAAW